MEGRSYKARKAMNKQKQEVKWENSVSVRRPLCPWPHLWAWEPEQEGQRLQPCEYIYLWTRGLPALVLGTGSCDSKPLLLCSAPGCTMAQWPVPPACFPPHPPHGCQSPTTHAIAGSQTSGGVLLQLFPCPDSGEAGGLSRHHALYILVDDTRPTKTTHTI